MVYNPNNHESGGIETTDYDSADNQAEHDADTSNDMTSENTDDREDENTHDDMNNPEAVSFLQYNHHPKRGWTRVQLLLTFNSIVIWCEFGWEWFVLVYGLCCCCCCCCCCYCFTFCVCFVFAVSCNITRGLMRFVDHTQNKRKTKFRSIDPVKIYVSTNRSRWIPTDWFFVCLCCLCCLFGFLKLLSSIPHSHPNPIQSNSINPIQSKSNPIKLTRPSVKLQLRKTKTLRSLYGRFLLNKLGKNICVKQPTNQPTNQQPTKTKPTNNQSIKTIFNMGKL